MKKLFTLLAALMLMVSASYAQQNYYFWKNGNVYIQPASQVDSISFSVGSWLFQMPKPECTSVSENSFQLSVKASWNDKVSSTNIYTEVGFCYSDENSEPTYNDHVKVLGTEMLDISYPMNNMVPGTTYFYRTYVRIFGEIFYSEVGSVTTLGEKPEKPQTVIVNGHNFVDLGLPSGLLWAETNIGASTPYEDGDYYAWGETETKSNYSWDTYKWGNPLTKYNTSDGKKILDSEDDVATVKWGERCHIPSIQEYVELSNTCDWAWLESYQGTCGFLITGTNGNSIFLPTSGSREKESFYNQRILGLYWTSSRNNDGVIFLLFTEGFSFRYSSVYFPLGLSVRPVANK